MNPAGPPRSNPGGHRKPAGPPRLRPPPTCGRRFQSVRAAQAISPADQGQPHLFPVSGWFSAARKL